MTANTGDGFGHMAPQMRRYNLDGAIVLELIGEFDLANREALSLELADVLTAQHHTLIIDLTRVGFCDVDCAAQLLAAGRRTQVALVGIGAPAVALSIDLLDPTDEQPRYPTLSEAALAFPHPPD